ncbi:DUF1761 domain-containing protein [Candidatus Saccharibacteria bacterium]|nr:DUF1761 domain-containing protein [Candidatus Saccharibacteria bacterium]
MPTVQINLWGVVAATAFAMVVGALWYSQPLFGKTWMALTGRKTEDVSSSAGQAYALTGILWLLASYVLAHAVQYIGADTALEGAVTGFWVWTGFVFTTGFIHTLFEGKSKKLFAINAGYTLFALIGMGVILVLLPN